MYTLHKYMFINNIHIYVLQSYAIKMKVYTIIIIIRIMLAMEKIYSGKRVNNVNTGW